MRKTLFIFLFIFLGSTLFAQRNLFSSRWNAAMLNEVIVNEWKQWPVYTDRSAWEAIPQSVKEKLIEEALPLAGKAYDFLPLKEYLAFVRDGNRSRYESIYFGRRSQLLQVIIAECAEGEGRFTDDILNGIWVLCEETSWCIPAHMGESDGIPEMKYPVVDLFAAETAAILAWTYYLFGSELDKISPKLTERIKQEIDNRILTPFLDRDDFWWMGFSGRTVNNWNPWILSNILPSALIIEKDRTRKIQIIAKSLLCLDQFTNIYPDDGGCDEGPGYWGRAGASLFDCLETLYSASEGNINYYTEPLVMNIGQYIYKAFIHPPWYINFADASPQIQPDAWLVYNFGKRIRDPRMMAFGAMLDSLQVFTVSKRIQSAGRSLSHLFHISEITAAQKAWPYVQDSWLPDLQVAVARSYQGSSKGMFFAAKGGHNAESHNHNDVGNFIVYYDGQPVIIDAGVGTYTSKTFSSDRYSIWSMQSQFHNLPTINGFMQEAGAEFAAKEPEYGASSKLVKFSLDISQCYPAAAGIQQWNRLFKFDRGNDLIIIDKFKLKEIKGTTGWNLITCLKPEIISAGLIEFASNGEYTTNKQLYLQYPENGSKVTIGEIILKPADGYKWTTNLYRIMITLNEMPLNGSFEFSIGAE